MGGGLRKVTTEKYPPPDSVLYPGNITVPQASITPESNCFCSPFAQLLLCNLGQSFLKALEQTLDGLIP